MLTSYHVHSNCSDGQATILDIVRAACKAGLDEIGISDHYVLRAGGQSAVWSMPLDGLPGYMDEIRAAARQAQGRITVRFGLEADFDPASAGELRELLAAYPFDYVIGSVHFFDGFPIDESKDHWDRLTGREADGIVCGYWEWIRQMAESRLFDFAAHLDLHRKFGYAPTVDISGPVAAALEAIAASGMAIEVNTAGWYKEHLRQPYPSPAIIRQCRELGIPALVTADAHEPAHLARGYGRAFELIRQAGYDQVAAFERRKMQMSGLPVTRPGS